MRGFVKAARAHILPPSLTFYDILKTVAVILMVIDHVGYYFFPDENMWRAVGRICVPIWIFLIGYARSRRIDGPLVIGMLAIVLCDALMGLSILPVNILLSIIVIRLILNPLMRFIGTNDVTLVLVTAGLFMVEPLLSFGWFYGSTAIIIAMSGYILRHGFPSNGQGTHFIPRLYAALACILFLGQQYQAFHFTLFPMAVMTLGCAAAFAAMIVYLPRAVANPETAAYSRIPTGFHPLFKFIGRHTLAIYVVHLLAFKIIAFMLCKCADCSCHPLGFHPLSLIL